MKTSEFIQLQVLKRKREILQRVPDFDGVAPGWTVDTYELSGHNRNICAMIPVPLFEEIDRLSGCLSISKRRIIELALRDFAVDANKAFDAAGFDSTTMVYESAGEVPSEEQ
jgi:hypothetical protein